MKREHQTGKGMNVKRYDASKNNLKGMDRSSGGGYKAAASKKAETTTRGRREKR